MANTLKSLEQGSYNAGFYCISGHTDTEHCSRRLAHTVQASRCNDFNKLELITCNTTCNITCIDACKARVGGQGNSRFSPGTWNSLPPLWFHPHATPDYTVSPSPSPSPQLVIITEINGKPWGWLIRVPYLGEGEVS